MPNKAQQGGVAAVFATCLQLNRFHPHILCLWLNWPGPSKERQQLWFTALYKCVYSLAPAHLRSLFSNMDFQQALCSNGSINFKVPEGEIELWEAGFGSWSLEQLGKAPGVFWVSTCCGWYLYWGKIMEKVKANLGHTWPQPELLSLQLALRPIPFHRIIRTALDLSQCAIRT